MVTPLDQYQDLTNAEDFAQVHSAKIVHIISTPFVSNKPAAMKAAATKITHDLPAAGVYVFNPNTGLKASAVFHGVDQSKRWLELWTRVARKVQETKGTCFVMARGTCADDREIEGNAQHGEIQIAEGFGIPIEYVYY